MTPTIRDAFDPDGRGSIVRVGIRSSVAAACDVVGELIVAGTVVRGGIGTGECGDSTMFDSTMLGSVVFGAVDSSPCDVSLGSPSNRSVAPSSSPVTGIAFERWKTWMALRVLAPTTPSGRPGSKPLFCNTSCACRTGTGSASDTPANSAMAREKVYRRCRMIVTTETAERLNNFKIVYPWIAATATALCEVDP